MAVKDTARDNHQARSAHGVNSPIAGGGRGGDRVGHVPRHPPGGRAGHLGVGVCASTLGMAAAAGLWLIVLACWGRAYHGWTASVGRHSIEVAHGVEIMTLAAAGLVAAWIATLLLVGAVAALPGRSTAPLRALAARVAPRLAPRVAAGLVTAVVALTPLGAAQASTGPVSTAPAPAEARGQEAAPALPTLLRDRVQEPEPAPRAPEPGWRPTTPPPTPDPEAISLVSRGAAEPDAVVVRSGDTLWDIAARHLGEDADAAATAEAWPRWYETNRALIGTDPDYLLPGTRLVPPQVSPQEVAP